MRWVRRLLNSVRGGGDLEQQIADEVQFHRVEYAADLEREGWSPDAARREAQRRLGLPGPWVAAAVAVETVPWVSTWRRETGQALRALVRRPLFLLATIATLSGGGGVLVAAVTVAHRALAPLPFPDASRLIVLEEAINGDPLGGNPARTADWDRTLRSVRGVAGLYAEQLVLGRGASSERVQALRGIGPFAQVLGLRPSLGRVFTEAEQRDGSQVVLLTDRGWSRLFGRSTDILGRVATLRGEPYEVIGVLPAAMDHPAGADLVAPAGPGYQRAPRVGNWLQVVGRLAPGATMAEAQHEASGIARRFAEMYADRERGLEVRLTTLQEFETRALRMPVLLLLGAALVVYLVVCVNVSGLLLVRVLARDQEAMVRVSLGASRWAMVRLVLHEASLMALAAVPGAWIATALVLQTLRAGIEPALGRVVDAVTGLPAAVAGAFLLVLSTLLLASWPAWHMATRAPGAGMASRTTTEAPGRRRVRRVLVAAQVACSTLLIVLALLLHTSLRQMLERPRGFDPTGVIAIRYDLDWEQPKTRIDELVWRVLQVVEQEPGVVAAGIVDRFPLQGGTQSTRVRVFGEPSVPADRPEVSVRSATPGYLGALRIPMLAGRPYVDARAPAAHREVVVNATFAMRYFGTTDVLGRRISVNWEIGEVRWLDIVGVAGDIRQGARDDAGVPEVYRPWSQAFWPLVHVVVRGDGSADLPARLRARLQRAVPDQPIALLASLDDVVAAGTREPAMLATVVSACGAAAALLAMLALYGLIAGEVLARRREVGIRLALGARTWPLRGWLLRPGLQLTSAGIGVGLAASIPAARAVEAQLFGVGTDNPAVRIWAAILVLSVGLCAALIPAWRVVGATSFAALRDP